MPLVVLRSRELAQRLPQGIHRTLEGVAHLSEMEQPATVVALLSEVLASG